MSQQRKNISILSNISPIPLKENKQISQDTIETEFSNKLKQIENFQKKLEKIKKVIEQNQEMYKKNKNNENQAAQTASSFLQKTDNPMHYIQFFIEKQCSVFQIKDNLEEVLLQPQNQKEVKPQQQREVVLPQPQPLVQPQQQREVAEEIAELKQLIEIKVQKKPQQQSEVQELRSQSKEVRTQAEFNQQLEMNVQKIKDQKVNQKTSPQKIKEPIVIQKTIPPVIQKSPPQKIKELTVILQTPSEPPLETIPLTQQKPQNYYDNSKLLSPNHYQLFKQWFEKDVQFSLLYQATRDGWKAADFHTKCDNQGKTLILIQSEYGRLFGGYANVAWESNLQYKGDLKCFIFTLSDKQKLAIKEEYAEYAIQCHPSCGPIFGVGSDIYIYSNSNTSDGSYSSLESYSQPPDTTANEYLVGSKYFKVNEMEVFRVL